MPRGKGSDRLAFATFATLLALATPAHAYIDPGSGSLFLQAMIAGLLGGVFVVKSYWRNITGSLAKALRRNGGRHAE